MIRRSHWALAVTIALAACQRLPAPQDDDGWEPPGPGEDDGIVPEGDGDGDGDGDGGPIDDINVETAGETAGDECQLVDILFVVDNSNSMAGEQSNLVDSFDGFIGGIQENLTEANDYHIGVVATDAYAHNPSGCQSMGALVTQTPSGDCGPWEGRAFLTPEDDLNAAFACAALVGLDGDGDEHQAEAAIEAISPAMNAQDGCNAGFLRDDALLVLVFITDEDDAESPLPDHEGSPGGPSSWFDALVERKGDVESNLVVLGLVGTLPPNACGQGDDGAVYASRLLDLIQRFTYGDVGDVCAGDYAPFFGDALQVIHDACLDFEPPD